MRFRYSILWLVAVGLIVFVALVVWLESMTRAHALRLVVQHTHAVAPALWNLDPRLSTEYLHLAASSGGYDRIVVRHPDESNFLDVRGPKLAGVEEFLARLHLLPRITLLAPVLYEGKVIGSIEAVWISRTIYREGYALLALLLLLVLIDRSVRVAEGKQLLEQRVADRTRRLAESESSHRQLTHLLDLSPDVIFVREPNGVISYRNKGADNFFATGDRDATAARMETLYTTVLASDSTGQLASEGLWVGEISTVRGNGTPAVLHASVTLTPDEQNRHQRALFISTEITEHKELENHLLRAQRTNAIGSLASGIAHDFNNLLTPILLSARLQRMERSTTPSVMATLETIETCARRGADLVRQLMNIAGNRPTHRTVIRPAEVLRDIHQLLSSTFPKNITVENHWPSDLPALEADPTNLHQAILNLCVNARDAMPQGGTLRLAASCTELDLLRLARQLQPTAKLWLKFSVSDTGTGIPAELHDKIFDPFFTTKAVGQGTGLGLATVQGIVQSHSGFIELDSAQGRGTTFTIYLPASATECSEPPTSARTTTRRGNGELILLVDDEPPVLNTAALLLKSYGYRVLTASSGAAALELHTENAREIRALLTDLMMPDMDGIALANELRTRSPQLPCAVMSGLLSSENRARLADAKIRGLLAKPFRTEELLSVLQRLLRDTA